MYIHKFLESERNDEVIAFTAHFYGISPLEVEKWSGKEFNKYAAQAYKIFEKIRPQFQL